METINKLVTSAINLPKTHSRQWPHLKPKADALMTCHSNLQSFIMAMDVATQDGYGNDEQRAHFCDAPMLCTIDAAYGDGASLKWMIPHIADLCHKCGVKGKLDDMQMASLAKMVRNEFGYLKASELMLFFYRLKAGHYGEFYGQVDSMRIMRALRGKFSDERAEAIRRHEGEQRDRERQEWAKTALKPAEVESLRKRLQDEGKI